MQLGSQSETKRKFRICCWVKKIEEKNKVMENSYPVFQIKEVSAFQRSFHFSALFVMIGKLIIFSKQNMFRLHNWILLNGDPP